MGCHYGRTYAAKAVHLPHRQGHAHASEYPERVHIDLVCSMPTKSVGRREYAYAVVDDAAYTRPLRLKSEAANAFKSFRAAAENEPGSTLRAVMNDNARELSMGGV